MKGRAERSRLPGAVVGLGFVSFFTDLSSEMIAPLLPAFLALLGAGPVFLGVVEGVANATAALGKIGSWFLVERVSRRKPLVVCGYALASVVRPLMALATLPWHVLGIRVTDRLGKGLRGTPRDALMADVTPADSRGRAYGFQRAMDHFGALLGPLLAWVLLELGDTSLRGVFAWAAVPAVIAVLVLVFAVRERGRPSPEPPPERARSVGLPSSRALRRYFVVVIVFALGNSSDLFLVARASDVGVPLEQLLLLWAAFHLIKSSTATPLGALSDRLGRIPVIGSGLVVYALVYFGFGFATEPWHVWVLFAIYGLHEALTEGAEKALIADLAGAAERGRAFGAFHAVTGVAALPASVLFGALWSSFGPTIAFAIGAVLAIVAVALLLLWVRPLMSVTAGG